MVAGEPESMPGNNGGDVPTEAVDSRGAAGDLPQSSFVFRLAEMPVHTGGNGGRSWPILQGRLQTGEEVALHESMQPAGVAANPAHRIAHTELICVREGEMEFLHEGRTERAGAGDVIFVADGTLHGVRNVGAGPAAYFVLAIGGDTNR